MIIVETLVLGRSVPGFPSLIVSVMFFSGIQLIFLGVIGEYVGRIFAEVKDRPLYIVRERIAPIRRIWWNRGRRLLRSADAPRDSLRRRLDAAVARHRLRPRHPDGAVLGAGQLMDVFTVAFRLPNHFRAIFGEGAFNSAFVPAFSRIRTQSGEAASSLFQGRILTLLLASQIVLLALALLFTPTLIRLLAPGFAAEPAKFALAVEITRITFPYLTLITLVTLWSGVLNSVNRYAAAAAAPVLLNLSLLAFVAMAWLFPTPAHAAGWGVFAAGLLEAALLAYAAWKAGVLAMRSPEAG